MVNLTPADVSDNAGAQTILTAIHKRWPWLKHLFVEAGYDRTKLMDKATFLDFVVEIVRRSDTAKGFEVIPRRWVVESVLPTQVPVIRPRTMSSSKPNLASSQKALQKALRRLFQIAPRQCRKRQSQHGGAQHGPDPRPRNVVAFEQPGQPVPDGKQGDVDQVN
jgi:hypothetical protein